MENKSVTGSKKVLRNLAYEEREEKSKSCLKIVLQITTEKGNNQTRT